MTSLPLGATSSEVMVGSWYFSSHITKKNVRPSSAFVAVASSGVSSATALAGSVVRGDASWKAAKKSSTTPLAHFTSALLLALSAGAAEATRQHSEPTRTNRMA